MKATFDALVACFEVGSEILRARLYEISEERNVVLARWLTGTGSIEQIQHVGRAPEESVVTCHAPAKLQSTVASFLHYDHVIRRTRDVERLELAIFFRLD